MVAVGLCKGGYPSGNQLTLRPIPSAANTPPVGMLSGYSTPAGILYRRILIKLQLNFDRQSENGLHLPQAPEVLPCRSLSAFRRNDDELEVRAL